MAFNIQKLSDEMALIRLSGRVDVMTSHILRSNMDTLAQRGFNMMIIDLKEVTFLDSSGLSALVSGLRLMRTNGGNLVLTRPNNQVMETLRITNFLRFFPIYDDPQKAISAVLASNEGVHQTLQPLMNKNNNNNAYVSAD